MVHENLFRINTSISTRISYETNITKKESWRRQILRKKIVVVHVVYVVHVDVQG